MVSDGDVTGGDAAPGPPDLLSPDVLRSMPPRVARFFLARAVRAAMADRLAAGWGGRWSMVWLATSTGCSRSPATHILPHIPRRVAVAVRLAVAVSRARFSGVNGFRFG